MQLATLESVIITPRLERRESRRPDYAAENRALVSVAQDMERSPEAILHSLAQALLTLCRAGSAGIGLIDADGRHFRWHAIAGALAPHAGATIPRSFSPSGTVVDRNAVQLFQHPQRHFQYLAEVEPAIVEALVIPFSFEGKPAGTIWVVTHDARRQFDAEDARLIANLGAFASAAYQIRRSLALSQEGSRYKDEFLSMLSHELRNPLAAMRAITDLFYEKRAEIPDLNRASGIMRRQLMHLDRLIGDAVDVAQIANGKLALRKERIDLASIVESAIEVSQPLIGAAHHSLAVTLPAAPVLVDADPTRLVQVVGNLLNNAAKYTKARGHLLVSVEVDDHQALIRVRDDGMGIAAGMLGTIFDLYAQAKPAGDGPGAGMGIGLALSKSLVELHGGTLEALSAGPDKGSEFVVRLPRLLGVAEASGTVTAPAVAALPQLRVLVVDDHRDTADALTWVLHSIGHKARAAYDGPSALLAFEEQEPDVIIQDLELPQMDGYEIARRMRERPAAKNALLVALTGSPRVEERTEAEAAFDLFLMKPLGLNTLESVLSSASARRRPKTAIAP
jgi:signal transduction histidine kinase/ActR/RegA family two-component response regulator